MIADDLGSGSRHLSTRMNMIGPGPTGVILRGALALAHRAKASLDTRGSLVAMVNLGRHHGREPLATSATDNPCHQPYGYRMGVGDLGLSSRHVRGAERARCPITNARGE